MNTTLARVIVAVVILGLVIGLPLAIRIWDRRTGGLEASGWDAPAPGSAPLPSAHSDRPSRKPPG